MQAYTCTTDLYVDGKLSKLVISLAVNKKNYLFYFWVLICSDPI